MYSHPHSAPQRIPMGNHVMGHRQIQTNLTSPRVSKVVVSEF